MQKFLRAEVARPEPLAGDPRHVRELAPSPRLTFVRRALCHPRAAALTITLTLALTGVGVRLGFTGDDYIHALMLRDDPQLEGLTPRSLDLFVFARGSSDETRGLMNEGVFPWWTDPYVVIAFFRPLSAATHWLDHHLWPEQPWMMHVHSMLWFALLLGVLSRVLRRLSPQPALAALALLLYALDDARAPTVGWLSNRNALVAAVPPLLALLSHHRYRADGHAPSRLLAPLWLLLGLLAGEAALPMSAYLLAYALCLERTPWRARALSLLPYAGVILVWRVAYRALGYGVHGSGLYLDPVGDPLGFLRGLGVRLPMLLMSQLALPFSETWEVLPVLAPSLRGPLLAWSVLAVGAIGMLAAPLLRRDRVARFWALGMLLATIPACAAVANDRLLTATGIGGAALLAHLIWGIYEGAHPSARLLAVRLAGGSLALLHLVLAPLLLPARTLGVNSLETLMVHADASIPSTPDIRDKTVVVLNPPVDPFADYFAPYRAARGIPRPKYFRWLATGVSDIAIERVDARTLKLRPEHGYWANSSQWMLRNPREPSHVGETVQLADSTFVVTALTADGRPAEVEVRFAEPLESPRFLWRQWGTHEYVPFTPPAIGRTATVPAIDMAKALFGPG